MENKKSSKTRLIEASDQLFRTRGYHSTSIADIAAACSLRKASIYHHISSKKELGIEVLQATNKLFSEKYFSIAHDDKLNEKSRIQAFAEAIEQYYQSHEGSCVVGNMIAVVDENPEFAQLIQEFHTNWVQSMSAILKKHYNDTTAIELAEETFAWTQGAVLAMQLLKSDKPLQLLRLRMISLLDDSKNNFNKSSVKAGAESRDKVSL